MRQVVDRSNINERDVTNDETFYENTYNIYY